MKESRRPKARQSHRVCMSDSVTLDDAYRGVLDRSASNICTPRRTLDVSSNHYSFTKDEKRGKFHISYYRCRLNRQIIKKRLNIRDQ